MKIVLTLILFILNCQQIGATCDVDSLSKKFAEDQKLPSYKDLEKQIPQLNHKESLAYTIPEKPYPLNSSDTTSLEIKIRDSQTSSEKKKYQDELLRIQKSHEKQIADVQSFKKGYQTGEFTEDNRYISIYNTKPGGNRFENARVDNWVVHNGKKYLKITKIDKDGKQIEELLTEDQLHLISVDQNVSKLFANSTPFENRPSILLDEQTEVYPFEPQSASGNSNYLTPSDKNFSFHITPIINSPAKTHPYGIGMETFSKNYKNGNIGTGDSISIMDTPIGPKENWYEVSVDSWIVDSGYKKLRVKKIDQETGEVSYQILTQNQLNTARSSSSKSGHDYIGNNTSFDKPAFSDSLPVANSNPIEVNNFRNQFNKREIPSPFAYQDPGTGERFIAVGTTWIYGEDKLPYLLIKRKNIDSNQVDEVILNEDSLKTARTYNEAKNDPDINPYFRPKQGPPEYMDDVNVVKPENVETE